MQQDERARLLQREADDQNLESPVTDSTKKADSTQYGPLEIPRSTRYGILAGIWAATFLSVRSYVRLEF